MSTVCYGEPTKKQDRVEYCKHAVMTVCLNITVPNRMKFVQLRIRKYHQYNLMSIVSSQKD